MSYDPTNRKKLLNANVGRIADVPQISPYEAKQKALLIIRRGLINPQTKLYNTISLLGTTGVLLEEQLLSLAHISKRTLRRYRKQGTIDLVPTPHTLQKLLNAKRIWALGPVGLQLAKLHFDLVPTGYLESKVDNITHDVLCNYVYVEILKAAEKEGATALLKSRYEIALKDFRNQQILQPDAMIILRSEGTETPFLVEYHHEDSSVRAPGKVKKYEYVYTDVSWEEQWNLTTFPPILIVTTHKAPAVGYKNDIEERSQGVGVRCRYLVKSLKSFLEETQSPLVWLDLAKKKTVNILP